MADTTESLEDSTEKSGSRSLFTTGGTLQRPKSTGKDLLAGFSFSAAQPFRFDLSGRRNEASFRQPSYRDGPLADDVAGLNRLESAEAEQLAPGADLPPNIEDFRTEDEQQPPSQSDLESLETSGRCRGDHGPVLYIDTVHDREVQKSSHAHAMTKPVHPVSTVSECSEGYDSHEREKPQIPSCLREVKADNELRPDQNPVNTRSDQFDNDVDVQDLSKDCAPSETRSQHLDSPKPPCIKEAIPSSILSTSNIPHCGQERCTPRKDQNSKNDTSRGNGHHSSLQQTKAVSPVDTLSYDQLLAALEQRRKSEASMSLRRYENMTSSFSRELSQLNIDYQRAEEKIQDLRAIISGQRLELDAAKLELEQGKAETTTLVQAKKDTTNRLSHLQKAYEKLTKENSHLHRQLSDCQAGNETLETSLKQLRHEHDQLLSEFATSKQSQGEERSYKAGLEARYRTLEERLAERSEMLTEERDNRLLISQQLDKALANSEALRKDHDDTNKANAKESKEQHQTLMQAIRDASHAVESDFASIATSIHTDAERAIAHHHSLSNALDVFKQNTDDTLNAVRSRLAHGETAVNGSMYRLEQSINLLRTEAGAKDELTQSLIVSQKQLQDVQASKDSIEADSKSFSKLYFAEKAHLETANTKIAASDSIKQAHGALKADMREMRSVLADCKNILDSTVQNQEEFFTSEQRHHASLTERVRSEEAMRLDRDGAQDRLSLSERKLAEQIARTACAEEGYHQMRAECEALRRSLPASQTNSKSVNVEGDLHSTGMSQAPCKDAQGVQTLQIAHRVNLPQKTQVAVGDTSPGEPQPQDRQELPVQGIKPFDEITASSPETLQHICPGSNTEDLGISSNGGASEPRAQPTKPEKLRTKAAVGGPEEVKLSSSSTKRKSVADSESAESRPAKQSKTGANRSTRSKSKK